MPERSNKRPRDPNPAKAAKARWGKKSMNPNIPTFLYLHGEAPGEEFLVNLHQVRTIDQITHDTVRLVFDGHFTVTVHGANTVSELLSVLGGNCITPSGISLAAVLSEAHESQESALSEDPGLKP